MSEPDIDDGSRKPVGYLTSDGELEVREYVNSDGILERGYVQTELGQHMHWMRQAPELYARYQAALMELAALKAKDDQP